MLEDVNPKCVEKEHMNQKRKEKYKSEELEMKWELADEGNNSKRDKYQEMMNDSRR